MRKAVTNDLSSFVTGKFRDNLIKFLEGKRDSEERNIQSSLKNIQDLHLQGCDEEDEEVESYRRAIRKYEDRKMGFVKKIQKMKSFDPTEFEKELKKNDRYDGMFVGEDNRLSLYTKTLKDGAHVLGKYRICISPDQSYGLNFDVVNLNYHHGALQHWAINGTKCCLGEWDPDFKDALFSGDIPRFFSLVIHYITLSPEQNTYTTKERWYEDRRRRPKTESEKLRTADIERISETFEQDEDDGSYDDDDDEADF